MAESGCRVLLYLARSIRPEVHSNNVVGHVPLNGNRPQPARQSSEMSATAVFDGAGEEATRTVRDDNLIGFTNFEERLLRISPIAASIERSLSGFHPKSHDTPGLDYDNEN
jgi:hypothetical protein